MVNETPQGFHASRKEKCWLHARSFRVTYCEGLVEEEEVMESERQRVQRWEEPGSQRGKRLPERGQWLEGSDTTGG